MAKINEYLTVGEAADLLGVSKNTLRRWDRAGKLEARRHPITGYRLYLRSELDAFLKRVRQQVSSRRSEQRRKRNKKKGGAL
ncbi:MAG: helix-turn-helix domain-containing protein [Planctomycetes bacterium]|nr:helix-turn-helix domain-containing protein [Planctomycetota bacterium]